MTNEHVELQTVLTCFYTDSNPIIPSDVCLICLHSAMAAKLIGFHSSQCVCLQLLRSVVYLLHCRYPEPSAADIQGFYFCRMLEQQRINAAKSRSSGREVRHRNNIKTSG